METHYNNLMQDLSDRLNDQNSNKFFESKQYSLDDLGLWRLFMNGDEGAFIKIYNEYINILYNQGKQLTYDHELIKDCLQDFFIYLRQHRGKLSDTNSIKLYLLKSFRRWVIAALKKNKRFFVHDPSLNEQIFPLELSFDEKLINAQFQEQQLERLNQGLKKLPVKEREALYYYFYQNLTYQEIAELYNYDHVASARRLIYKALKKLKGFLVFFLLIIF